MPVFRGSRYENVRFTGILGEDGKVRRYLHTPDALPLQDMPEPIVVHEQQSGEVIDELPHRFVAKPRLWWVVAYVSDVLFPLEIEPGTELFVPTQFLLQQRDVGT